MTFVGLVVRALVGEEHTTRAWVVLLSDLEHHLSKRYVNSPFMRLLVCLCWCLPTVRQVLHQQTCTPG